MGLFARRSALRENRRLPRAEKRFTLTTHGFAEFLCGVKATQRLQSCRRVRDCGVARNADRGDRSSGAASVRCDYEYGSLACYPGFPDRVDPLLCLLADSGMA